MKTIVKIATSKDLDSINRLLRLSKGYWGYDNEFLEKFMRQFTITEADLAKEEIRLFYIDEKLAGFYSFIINDENKLELNNLFLHPDFVGKGFGRQLWELCCGMAKEYDKTEFIIWSDPHAEAFYLKMGCEKIGVRQSLYMPDRYPPVLRYKMPSC